MSRFAKIAVEKKYLPLGGFLSGFFGGLSGHQGAWRSVFLLKSGLSKESFIATGVVITLMVDIPRIIVYSARLPLLQHDGLSILAAAILAAFSGAYLGNRLLKKVTLQTIQILVALMLLVIAAGLCLGLI